MGLALHIEEFMICLLQTLISCSHGYCSVRVLLTVADQTCLNGQLHTSFYAVLLLAATPSTTGDTNPGPAEYCVSSF